MFAEDFYPASRISHIRDKCLGNGKAFGRLDLTKPLELRRFEQFFGIISREGPEAWEEQIQECAELT